MVQQFHRTCKTMYMAIEFRLRCRKPNNSSHNLTTKLQRNLVPKRMLNNVKLLLQDWHRRLGNMRCLRFDYLIDNTVFDGLLCRNKKSTTWDNEQNDQITKPCIGYTYRVSWRNRDHNLLQSCPWAGRSIPRCKCSTLHGWKEFPWPVESEQFNVSGFTQCVFYFALLMKREKKMCRPLTWISISAAWPWAPPRGWWIMMRLLGRARRLPLAPAPNKNAPIEAAIPKLRCVDSIGWEKKYDIVEINM